MDYEPDDAGTSVQRVPAATDPYEDTFTQIIEAVTGGTPVRRAIAATTSSCDAFYRHIDRTPGAPERYARARAAMLDALADETVEIADDAQRDTITTDDGDARMDAEWVARSRLRVDTRKWLLSKLAPKKYGDLVHVEHSGNIGNALAERLTDARKRIGSLTGTD